MDNSSISPWDSFKHAVTTPIRWLSSLDLRTRNPLDGHIERIQRKAAHALDCSEVPADLNAFDCLVLKGVEGSFWGLKTCPKEERTAIALIANGSEVFVHPEELAERFGLDPFDVMQNANFGTLDKFLTKSKVVEIFANYQRLVAKQKKNPETVLELALLMKVIRTAFQQKQNGDLDFTISYKLTDREIIVGFRENNVYLQDITKKELLAKGGQSQIYKVSAIGSKKGKVIKIPLDFLGVKHEAKIIQKLHESYPKNEQGKRRIPGIVDPFYEVVNLGPQFCGMMRLCDGNLDKAIKRGVFVDIKDKLLAFQLILLGFKFCVSQGLIHGDIKPWNIFYIQNPETKEVKLFLGDFGSAALYPKDMPQVINYDQPWARGYWLNKDNRKRRSLGKQASDKPSVDTYNEYVNHCQKCDIFSLGITLAEFLAPSVDFIKYDIELGLLPSTFKRKYLEEAGVPRGICDLIAKMIKTIPKERPTINEVVDLYGKHI